MSKNNEEYDIEKIFQKAANEFPAVFDERDWQAMKSLLDQERLRTAAVRKKNVTRLILSLAAVLFLSVLFYLLLPGNEEQYTQSGEGNLALIQNSGQKDPIDETPESSIENTKKTEKNERENRKPLLYFSPSDSKTETPVIKHHRKEDASGVFPQKKKASEKLQSTHSAHPEKHRDTPKSEQKLSPESSDQGLSANYSFKNKKVSSKSISSPTVSDEESINQSRSIISTGESLETNKNIDIENQQTNVQVIPDPKAISEEGEDETINTPIIKEEEEEDAFRPDTRLSTRIIIGPDLSALRLGKLTSPGYSYGLMLHYHLNSKLLIGVGALKSTKKYLGKGDDYNIPSAYWKYATNNIVPDRVAGECAILEIPLDLQYNLMTSKKHNFYLSGGISSYFMISESYEYTFEEPNPYAKDSWSSSDADERHLLNIINFSVGYERTINKRLKLGIAPYLKAPIKGIGWSNVKFISMGTYFSVRYSVIQKKK